MEPIILAKRFHWAQILRLAESVAIPVAWVVNDLLQSLQALRHGNQLLLNSRTTLEFVCPAPFIIDLCKVESVLGK